MSERSPTTTVDLQWIESLVERDRALLGAMLVQLNAVGRAMADRCDPRAADGHPEEWDARTIVEAVVGRLRADDERLGVLARHLAQILNG